MRYTDHCHRKLSIILPTVDILRQIALYHLLHYDNEQIRADFNELYQQMNGMPLQEMDKIICPVCTLCRDHEKAGFIEGIHLGVLLAQELGGVEL